jgi:hypothetical protein
MGLACLNFFDCELSCENDKLLNCKSFKDDLEKLIPIPQWV